MAYVDLNPIRAAMARSPENSDYTSIQERIKSKSSNLLNLGFDENDIPYNLTDYLDLVDFTGRAILANKKGFIPDDLPPILNRLGLDETTWLNEIYQFKFQGRKAIMIYIHVYPTACRLRRSSLILSHLVARCNN